MSESDDVTSGIMGRRLRRFQFGVWDLFGAVTVCCVVFGLVASGLAGRLIAVVTGLGVFAGGGLALLVPPRREKVYSLLVMVAGLVMVLLALLIGVGHNRGRPRWPGNPPDVGAAAISPSTACVAAADASGRAAGACGPHRSGGAVSGRWASRPGEAGRGRCAAG